VCSKKEKKGQNIKEKDLTGPTLLEMDELSAIRTGGSATGLNFRNARRFPST